MERIIEKIKDRMAQYNLTSYNIAKNTGIGQSHLSMIFNGKRKIKPAQFYAIIEQIPMPLKAKSNLADEFCRLYFTEEKYLSIKYIRELFKQLSDLTSSVEGNKKLMDPQISGLGFKDTVYRGSDISLVIAQALVNEFASGSEAIYAYLPLAGNIETLKNCIDSIVRVYKHNTKLYAFLDYLGYPQQGATNIEKLKNLLPLALSDDTDSYEFYASNVPSEINANYSTPYPYFIALSSCVVFLSANCDEMVLHSDPEVIKSVYARCEGRLKHYNRCIKSNTDVYSMVNEVVKGQGSSDYFCSLEYEPCLAMHFNIDIINDIVYPDLPPQVRESVLSLANERLMQLKCIKKSKRIFNKNSLMEFAKTGIIYELKDYARPLEPRERLVILKNLYESGLDKNHTLLALNPANLLLSERVSMYQSNDFVLFSIWNSAEGRHKYCSLYEKSIYNAFLDFIDYLTESYYVYSETETLKFIEEAINYTQELCK